MIIDRLHMNINKNEKWITYLYNVLFIGLKIVMFPFALQLYIYVLLIHLIKKMNGYSEGLSDGAGLNQYIQYLYTTFGTYPTS